jgi:hypothetical protein
MTDSRGKFEEDLNILVARLTADMEEETAKQKLIKLKCDLLKLHKQNVVKINHSVMELVCAKYLVLKGYDVEIEYPLDPILVCDLFSTKGYGNLIVEIETGYIPPEHAMDPLTYTTARLGKQNNPLQQLRRKIRHPVYLRIICSTASPTSDGTTTKTNPTGY